MEDEINRRLAILNSKRVPVITKRDLRGGMQKRVHRQELKRYSDGICSQRQKLQDKLASLQSSDSLTFGVSSSISNELEDFNEPVFRGIRSKRGFF